MIMTSGVTLRFGKRVLFEDVNIKFVNGKKADIVEELLSRYKDGSTLPIIKVMFFASLFICLWFHRW